MLAHGDKQQAGPTFKKTFGFHPLTAWCDTDESLVVKLRPGRAGSNTAADHIEVGPCSLHSANDSAPD